jgi:hypothetical protein
MVLRTDAPEIPGRRNIRPGAQPQSQVLDDPYFLTTLEQDINQLIWAIAINQSSSWATA